MIATTNYAFQVPEMTDAPDASLLFANWNALDPILFGKVNKAFNNYLTGSVLDISTSGYYNVSGAVTDLPSTEWFKVFAYILDTNNKVFLAIAADAANGTMLFRQCVNGTWGGWKAFRDGGNANTLDGYDNEAFVHTAGDTMTGALKGIIGNGIRTYTNLGGYLTSADAHTGTMKITLPVGMTNTMLLVEIAIYNYLTGTSTKVIVGGYSYSSPSWINTYAYVSNASLCNSVRFAYDGSKACILLGTTETVWHYPQVSIERVTCGYSGLDGYDGAWSVSFLTSEAGLTAVAAVSINTGLNADSVDGLHVHTGTNNVANQIVRTDANGYINAGWINTISGAASGTLTRIYCSQDAYLRYLSPAAFKTALGITTPGASVDWSIVNSFSI